MKTIKLLSTLISMFASLLSGVLSAHGATNVLERRALPSRTHRTWEGVYKFSGESTVKISGLKDLYVLKYCRSGSEGDLIDFAECDEKGNVRFLREANTNVKGVTPIFEGVDVLPDDAGAEIVVRWRHPGQGGFRMVEKYRYTSARVVLVNRSEFIEIDGEKQWISETALDRKEAEMKSKYPAVREAPPKGVKGSGTGATPQ
ncbi:MAG: hypothetical protein ACOX7Q_05240 [Kiritimatiellia bacterium]|jgi:hypothetical protein